MKTNFEELESLTREEIRAHAHHYENENPAIYLGTYYKYNCGSLYGMWIDITTFDDYEDFYDFCRRLHQDENAPEFMVQDFEYFPKSWYHESGLPTEEEFDRIKEYTELDEDEQKAYELYLDNFDGKADVDEFRDHYEGYYKSGEDFAEYICEECGYFKNLPDWLQCCIDYSAVWRNLDTSGDYSEYDGHIFR